MEFTFAIYDDNGDFREHEFSHWDSVKAAKARAARLAKKHGGPVDFAYNDARPWNDRYITTVSATFLDAWYQAGTPKAQSWVVQYERLD